MLGLIPAKPYKPLAVHNIGDLRTQAEALPLFSAVVRQTRIPKDTKDTEDT